MLTADQRMRTRFVAIVVALALSLQVFAQDAGRITAIPPHVLDDAGRAEARGMIDRYIAARTKRFNEAHREQWAAVKTRAQWEEYRDQRLQRLQSSLGTFPAPGKPDVRVTGVVKGDGFEIQNLLYQGRPGQWVPANLYRPAATVVTADKPPAERSMPGILINTSHHTAKISSELQDMGMTWARAGCQVLVIDQVGYGERRTHPFNSDADYAKPYRASRQDYYFRYDSGVQLQLLGDSLMGWMTWDLMRGVDVLLARPETDPKRIILLGSVAGGGDPAGVAAAIDPRIACVVPFNFGGPQPETRFPLPDDAETNFNFFAGAYWDSTRGLRCSADLDFPHWVIAASVAPRKLIHAHEFSWDGVRDPVWKRYQKVWGEFYGEPDSIGVATGKGLLKQQPPEASHCTHIGRFHRRMIHPLFEKWFGIRVREEDEYSAPRKREELLCWTDAAHAELKPKRLTELMTEEADRRVAAARQEVAGLSADARRAHVRKTWQALLGTVEHGTPPRVVSAKVDADARGAAAAAVASIRVERIVLETEPGIVVPTLVLSPAKENRAAPLVLAASQAGKSAFLKERSADLHKLLNAGAVVVLPDLRGAGESAGGSTGGRDSARTNQSVHVQLFGVTPLGQRLADFRSVLTYARNRPDVVGRRVVLWGDSFTAPNPPDTDVKVPHAVDGRPKSSEPLGALVAVLTTLYDDEIAAVYAAGGIAEYRAALGHYSVLVPHDATVPGAVSAGDLPLLLSAMGKSRVHLAATVDHLNRTMTEESIRRMMSVDGVPNVTFSETRGSPADRLSGNDGL